ncbi:COMM domain-containing protein 10-like [Coccinella septempunctata]|uniref:COMM domain-containing protein 10-like n=1 Tax=Coccinella septempunctata TaxID=41139 RepID=UPI001D062397|nr:COMM domain-containing protein 10-like [Coccinella septempunctata]
MATSWSNSVPRSKKLDEGIHMLKSVSLEIFQWILGKIQTKEIFTDNDIENLMKKLKLSELKVKHIIETVSYLHKHLSKIILKPAELEKALIEDFNIEEDKAHSWIKIWTEDISQNFNLGNINELQSITWELNLEAASNLSRKKALPTASIQLNGTIDNTVLHLNEEELVHLYNTLENIQAKLDM